MLRDAMSSIFGLRKLIVGNVAYNSAKKGQDYVGTDMWGDDYAMVCKTADPGDPVDVPCIGRIFQWTADAASLVTLEEYDSARLNGTVFRARQWTDEVIIDPNYGHLMQVDV